MECCYKIVTGNILAHIAAVWSTSLSCLMCKVHFCVATLAGNAETSFRQVLLFVHLFRRPKAGYPSGFLFTDPSWWAGAASCPLPCNGWYVQISPFTSAVWRTSLTSFEIGWLWDHIATAGTEWLGITRLKCFSLAEWVTLEWVQVVSLVSNEARLSQ